MSSAIPIYAPGAHSHARWMAKIIYTIKKALFRDQLKELFKPQILHSIQNLATVLSLLCEVLAMLNKGQRCFPVGCGISDAAGRGKN